MPAAAAAAELLPAAAVSSSAVSAAAAAVAAAVGERAVAAVVAAAASGQAPTPVQQQRECAEGALEPALAVLVGVQPIAHLAKTCLARFFARLSSEAKNC